MKAKLFNKLSTKLVIIISIVLITILSIHTFLTIQFFRNNLMNISRDGATAASDIIKRSMRNSMLLNRRDDILQTIRTIGNEPGIKKVRIYNKIGEITYSSDTTEIGMVMDKSSEACISCHIKPNSKPHIDAPEAARMFMMENERVLGLINPIRNDADCYTSSCHAHKRSDELLGVLDVLVSMNKADETIATGTKNIIINSVIITFIIAGVSGLLIFNLVNKPLKKFQKAFAELGKGNLNYKVYLKNKNEFGIIANNFNDMSRKLSTAYQEIKDWSETLNDKVEEKTHELKIIYDQIIQMEKLASLGKLSATVAHELNNPLEGILTFSKLISKKLAVENNSNFDKLVKYSDLITEESARCGKIVKDLLLFSHSDIEKFIPSDLVTLINNSITLINHHLELNNVELEKKTDSESLIINCNPQKIQQMLISIMINAIESMSGKNDAKLSVHLSKSDDHAIIRIKDTGMGISDKDLPHIFEPFYTTKEMSKGTGLGLSVVYGIINLHKGNISVENTSIKGTTFKISLPFDLTNIF